MSKEVKKVISEYKPQENRGRFTIVLEDIHSQNKIFGESLDIVKITMK